MNTSNREIVVHNVSHCRQKLSWDCGVASVMMLLPEPQRKHLADNFDAVCEDEGFGQNTWSIDLCYLLKRYGLEPHLYTSSLGVKGYHLKRKLTDHMFQKICERVQKRFELASASGIKCTERTLTCEDLVEKVQAGPVIVLVDAWLLPCDHCKLNKMSSEIRSVWGGSYRGHYVVLVGADAARRRFVYRNPARCGARARRPPPTGMLSSLRE